MSDRFRKPLLIVLAIALTIALGLAAGCGTKTAEEPKNGDGPVVGGDLVIGYEQEPQILNPFIEGGDMMATKDVISNVLYGLLRVKPDFTYEPLLAEEVPTLENGLVTENPFTVTWKLKKDAKWSDGTAVSSADVKFTWETVMKEDFKILSRLGYEDIESVETPDDKTVKVTFKKTYAPYRDLFSVSYCVLPKHALEGKDFNTVMNESIPVASGPFVFSEWKKGDSITLKRNDGFWGTKANLDSATFKYIPDTNTQLAQFKTGEVDVINPAPDVNLLDQMKESGEVQADPGTIWEHMAFNMDKDHVKDVKVRQAIAYAIDRQAIVDQVMMGQVKTLNSILVPEQATFYSPAWEKYTLDKAKAESLLAEAGYAKGADGYYAKDGKRLSLEIKTTAGNKGREKIQQIMQANLKDVGIELKINNEDATKFFGESTTGGNFVIGIWAWLASPDPSQTTLFSEDSIPDKGQNYYRYRNKEVTRWLKDSDATADEAERADLLKKVQTQMAEDVPLIPLYQRLSVVAFRPNVYGPQNNPTIEGVFWNLGEWWMDKEAEASK